MISGYSSFVNIVRQRTVDFIFASPEQELIYARITYDTPNWDIDHLRIWKHSAQGDTLIHEFTPAFEKNAPELATIQKLRLLAADVYQFVLNGKNPDTPFADLDKSIELQQLLNTIEAQSLLSGPSKYTLKETREIFTATQNLETLG